MHFKARAWFQKTHLLAVNLYLSQKVYGANVHHWYWHLSPLPFLVIHYEMAQKYLYNFTTTQRLHLLYCLTEGWQSGRMHRSWKPAGRKVSGVRIPLPPPISWKETYGFLSWTLLSFSGIAPERQSHSSRYYFYTIWLILAKDC